MSRWGGGPADSSTGPPTDTFGVGSTVPSGAPGNTADPTRRIQLVLCQMNPLGVAQQVAEETARRVSSQNDARWQDMQARTSASEGGSVVSGGHESSASVGRYAPTLGRGSTRSAAAHFEQAAAGST